MRFRLADLGVDDQEVETLWNKQRVNLRIFPLKLLNFGFLKLIHKPRLILWQHVRLDDRRERSLHFVSR